METKKYLLEILVMLARSDSDIDEKEKIAIKRIARSRNFPEEEIERMFKLPTNPKILENIKELSFKSKFDILYYLVAIMKADNQVLNEEILFLQKITTLLGFELAAIMEIYHGVNTNIFSPSEKRLMRKKAEKFFLDKEGISEPASDES
ncbi:MAG: hypothetical protein OXB93_00160 [Cytophagales bacterium]|nr:hypothetical protein [Cytophagales bacterium]